MKNNKQIGFFIVILIIVFGCGAIANELIFHNTQVIQKPYATVLDATDATTETATTSISNLPPEYPVDYTDNRDGTITDHYTGLLWMKCPEGMSGTNCQSGSPSQREWGKARAECANLTVAGKTGWRLPTLKELQSIVDSDSFRPAINTKFFGASSDPYWTSTPLAEHLSGMAIVVFVDGSTYYVSTGTPAATRCVWSGNTN
jgi:hypothetical protein